MSRSTRRITATMVLAVLAAALGPIAVAPAGAAARPVNLVRDGEFEIRIPHDDVAAPYAPGRHLGAWKVTVATVAVGKPQAGLVSGISGRQRRFLWLKNPFGSSSDSVGSVCQRVDIDPAAAYQVRFFSAAVSHDDVLIVVWDGSAVGQFVESASTGTTAWTAHTIDLASRNRSIGKLCFTGAGSGFPVVDAVRLTTTTA